MHKLVLDKPLVSIEVFHTRDQNHVTAGGESILGVKLCNSCSQCRAQYGIDLPGSLHTNKIPVILGRYPLPRFCCRLNSIPLDRDSGTFNSSHTDVVEKVNCLVAASQHGGTSVAEGSP